MQIVHYPHPTLRHKSKPVRTVDAELRAIVAEMFELMYESRGVGLAANQVDLPIRMFVANLAAEPDEGEELVFINPVLTRPKGNEEAEEGCLSLPGLFGPVRRPKQIRVQAYDLKGELIEAELTGLLSRVVQHETDHLDGVLFVDRMSDAGKKTLDEALEEFEIAFNQQRETGEVPDDDTIAQRLRQFEQRYC